MNITYEDIEILARLEVDSLVEAANSVRDELGINDVANGHMIEIISESFLNGVEFGVTLDPYVDGMEVVTEKIVSLYEDGLSSSVALLIRNGYLMTIDEVLVLRSRFFADGISWTLTYKNNNSL